MTRLQEVVKRLMDEHERQRISRLAIVELANRYKFITCGDSSHINVQMPDGSVVRVAPDVRNSGAFEVIRPIDGSRYDEKLDQ